MPSILRLFGLTILGLSPVTVSGTGTIVHAPPAPLAQWSCVARLASGGAFEADIALVETSAPPFGPGDPAPGAWARSDLVVLRVARLDVTPTELLVDLPRPDDALRLRCDAPTSGMRRIVAY